MNRQEYEDWLIDRHAVDIAQDSLDTEVAYWLLDRGFIKGYVEFETTYMPDACLVNWPNSTQTDIRIPIRDLLNG